MTLCVGGGAFVLSGLAAERRGGARPRRSVGARKVLAPTLLRRCVDSDALRRRRGVCPVGIGRGAAQGCVPTRERGYERQNFLAPTLLRRCVDSDALRRRGAFVLSGWAAERRGGARPRGSVGARENCLAPTLLRRCVDSDALRRRRDVRPVGVGCGAAGVRAHAGAWARGRLEFSCGSIGQREPSVLRQVYWSPLQFIVD